MNIKIFSEKITEKYWQYRDRFFFTRYILFSLFDCLQGDQAHFEVLAQSYHYGQITGLDVCHRKPLVATCGLDRSVRIWNFETW